MPPKPEVLSDYLLKHYPGASYHSAYEVGFCGLWAHYQLCELGINNIVVNPADVPGTQKDKLQKEDKRDSRKIAYALRSGNLTPIYTPSLSTLNDRSLIRSRKTLVNDMVSFKNCIKGLLHFYGIAMPEEFANSRKHWNRRFMVWLGSIHMKELSGEMALKHQISEALYMKELLKCILLDIKHLSQTDKYRENVRLLRSIPGIALLTAMVILTEVEDINRFPNSERFASFIGLIPMTKSSGEKQKVGEITFRAHDFLRSIIIESSWVAVSRDPALLMAYQKLIKRMEPNNAILRRFSLHILPQRFVKIRRFGIYNHTVKRNMELQFVPTDIDAIIKQQETPETTIERFQRLTGINPCLCPVCKTGRMVAIRELPRIRSPAWFMLNITHAHS